MEIDEDPLARPDPLLDWRVLYLDCLVRETLPVDKTEARRLARRAKSFDVIEDELYKKSRTGILQWILTEQGEKLLDDIHRGSCEHHAGPRTLVDKAFQQGFYWPTTVADAEWIVRTYEGCQFYAWQTHLPAQVLHTIPITWPFVVWGLDLVGPLKKAPGGHTHLLVTVDKFTKWIEAWPIMKIRFEEAIKFFTDIIHRFGVPNSIITDNGTQFTGKKFLRFCDENHIRVDWAAMAHPHINGQVERANDMMLQGLKPRIFNKLNKFGERWVAELPAVLWSLRTTPSRAMGYTPFFMVYGTEAVLPTDVDYGAPIVVAYKELEAKEYLEAMFR
jgi:transposase InsO family protein